MLYDTIGLIIQITNLCLILAIKCKKVLFFAILSDWDIPILSAFFQKAQNGGPSFDLGAVFPLLSDPGLQMIDLIESNDPLFSQNFNNSDDQNQMILENLNSSSGSYYSQSVPPSEPFDLNASEGIDEFVNLKLFESIQEHEELIKPHEQAMDNDDYNLAEDWNPLAQLQRIHQKLSFLEKQKSTKVADLESMGAGYSKYVWLIIFKRLLHSG